MITRNIFKAIFGNLLMILFALNALKLALISDEVVIWKVMAATAATTGWIFMLVLLLRQLYVNRLKNN
ncbi:MAG: hypothetical protein ACXITV_02315 [Luteibaculaceae bacterium]